MSTAKRERKGDHCVMWRGGFKCLNCGREFSVQYPIEPYMFDAQAKAFTKEHAKCKKTWQEPSHDSSSSIGERMEFWLRHGYRGVSSETIFAVLKGSDLPITSPALCRSPAEFCHPLDPSDFNRCHKLLEIVPEWRDRLDELKALGDPWPALVDNWDKLTEMLKEHLAGGDWRPMYDFMKELGC